MLFFVGKIHVTFNREKTFQIKMLWNCMEEYKNVNKFCVVVQNRLEEVFQNTMGMKRSQNLSNKEKTALNILKPNKNVI